MSGTIIDSLYVTLGLDSAQFTKGSADAQKAFNQTGERAKKTFTDVEANSKKTANQLAGLKGEVVGLFLAFAGAKSVSGFVLDTINATANVGRLGSVMGANTAALYAWGKAFESVGGSASDAATVFGKIQSIQADMLLNPASVDYGKLGMLGFNGDPKQFDDQESVMYRLADNFAQRMANAGNDKHAQKTQKAAFGQLAAEKFGFSQNDISLIEQGHDAIKSLIDGLKKNAPTEGDVAAAEDFNAAWVKLKATIAGFSLGPITDAINALNIMLSGSASPKVEDDHVNLDTITGLFQAVRNKFAGRDMDDNGSHRTTPKNNYNDAADSASTDNESIVKRELLKQGVSPKDVPYFMAAIAAENDTFKTNRTNRISAGKHHATGLGQLVSGDRYADFESQYHKPYGSASPAEQVAFMLYEMKKRGINAHGRALTMSMIKDLYSPGIGTRGDIMRADDYLARLPHRDAVRNAKARNSIWARAFNGPTSILVTVNGHGKDAQKIGKEIADATHKHLKRSALAIHAQGGLG